MPTPSKKVYFDSNCADFFGTAFSGYVSTQDISSADIVCASNWQELKKIDSTLLIDKQIICQLVGLPYAHMHDVNFRDLPQIVGLWIVDNADAKRQTDILALSSILAGDFSAQSLAAVLPNISKCKALSSRGLRRSEISLPPRSALKRGLQAIGLSPKPYNGLTVSIFREFVKPPYGGGNQFMLALKETFEKNGVRVLVNEISEYIDGYFFDSLWFDERQYAKLERLQKPVIVHRIDGPIYLYRGKDREIDDKIFMVNSRLATSTIIQSDFTLEKTYESGYRPIRPVVINNAVSPKIFSPKPIGPIPRGRKVRIIATSWSDNANKGGPAYKWLEENLDWNRFEFTFVGRCSETLTKAKVIAPVASEALAELLREHDIYITASKNDPCSNALIEALTCGLPAVVLNSGGHPELVGKGGLCFNQQEEILSCLDRIVADYEKFCSLLSPAKLEDVADAYLNLVKNP